MTPSGSISAHPRERQRLFFWWHDVDAAAHRALIAASLGWMLDAMDVMLYSMVLASVMEEMNLTKTAAGILGSVTLVGAAVGGMAFGFVADRAGRTRALMASILLYSIFTGLCGLSQNFWQFAVCRWLLGVGMGGEWPSGAALMSETWPARHWAKAFAFMQSSWAVGYGVAAVVTALVLPHWGWRAVFFVGTAPALLTLWVRRHIDEPNAWRSQRAADAAGIAKSIRFADIFRGRLGRLTAAVTLMNACTMFGWWGLNLWIPAYLALPPAEGGIGLSAYATSGLVVAMQVGMWLGYITFGSISHTFGQKRAYVMYVLLAAVLLPLYGVVRNPLLLLVLGPFVAFFGTGYFGGFGPLTAEIYPTAIRATAQGFTYNIGRISSAVAPFAVGSLAQSGGFAVAFTITGVAFLLAGVCWIWIPATYEKPVPAGPL